MTCRRWQTSCRLLLLLLLVEEVLVMLFENLLEDLRRQRVRALDLTDRVPLLDRLDYVGQVLDLVG